MRVPTLLSGNTLGARWWTDGRMIAPMLPSLPAITRCHGCGRYFWISEAKGIGYIHYGLEEPPPEWKAARRARELSEQEYLEAIQSGLARTRKQELYLRIWAWWASNDPLRFTGLDETQTPPRRSPEALMNLERLLELLDETHPAERLQKAEVLRELERFDEALRLLEFDFPDQYEKVTSLIRELAQRKDPLVREIG